VAVVTVGKPRLVAGPRTPPVARRPRQLAGLVILLGLLATAGLPACFNPQQPGCAFSCASDGLCPSGYSCGGDRLCHRTDGQGTCTASPPSTDGAVDGTVAPTDGSGAQ
jgi:hypothetical protein